MKPTTPEEIKRIRIAVSQGWWATYPGQEDDWYVIPAPTLNTPSKIFGHRPVYLKGVQLTTHVEDTVPHYFTSREDIWQAIQSGVIAAEANRFMTQLASLYYSRNGPFSSLEETTALIQASPEQLAEAYGLHLKLWTPEEFLTITT